MKKKTALALVTLTATLMMTGCGASETAASVESQPIGGQTQEAVAETEPAGQSEAVAEKSKEQETGTEESKETLTAETGSENAESAALVEAFLAGEGIATVKDGYFSTLSYVDGTLDAGASYTLDQLETEMVTYQLWDEVVDCGFSGETYQKVNVAQAPGDWYVLSLDILEGGSFQVGEEYFLAQVLDGQLNLVLSVESYYRTDGYFNASGVAYSGGSSGAGAYGVDTYGVDQNGDARLLSRTNTVWYGWELMEGDQEYRTDLTEAFEAAAEALGQAGLDINSVTLTQYEIDGKYYYFLDSDDEAALVAAKESFEQSGITLDDEEGVRKIYLDYAASFGVTEDALNVEALVW